MLYNGEGGERNIDKAKKMFELAAEQGNTQAKPRKYWRKCQNKKIILYVIYC